MISSLQTLCEILFTVTASRMSLLVSENTSINDALAKGNALLVWCKVLSFRRWLHMEDPIPLFGKPLVAKILSANDPFPSPSAVHQSEDVCSGTLAILLDEFQYCAISRRSSHLDVVVATYLSFCRIFEFNGESATSNIRKISVL